ncbi:hypothetical protein HRF59_05215 [Bacillus velezensis]|uniref:hypothetical protein n=1 Tax=Bacillus amyloliquefaciens group TaxID=1938374 RepID=UPI0003A71EBF|nr:MULTISPECIES: hypothetical protein [Bacillus amyloliquefaciens group]AUS16025.1 hypothetical protein C0W57_07440 [Bacillus velezensis]KAF1274289.1 hypothetical protein BUE72_17200 [Bacillus amyloliquefaciens]MCO6398336.1 hypothetical protein [Bacillus velezensis]NHN21016.1 hypothetical protein [Bacillus amyloliquefaciens]NRG13095.1 hypothetical protein [Bacillus velezensis]
MENTYRYYKLNKELQAVKVVSGLLPKESEAYRELIKIEIEILEEKRELLNGKGKMNKLDQEQTTDLGRQLTDKLAEVLEIVERISHHE